MGKTNSIISVKRTTNETDGITAAMMMVLVPKSVESSAVPVWFLMAMAMLIESLPTSLVMMMMVMMIMILTIENQITK